MTTEERELQMIEDLCKHLRANGPATFEIDDLHSDDCNNLGEGGEGETHEYHLVYYREIDDSSLKVVHTTGCPDLEIHLDGDRVGTVKLTYLEDCYRVDGFPHDDSEAAGDRIVELIEDMIT